MKAGWQKRTLSEVCKIFADGDWIESKDQSPAGIRLIQTGNVGEGVFKDRSEKARYISEETFERLKCTEIFENDCLISRLPDPVGRSCLLPDTGERMITAVDCTIIRFDESRMIPSFFNYYSQSFDYLSVVDSETTGTTRKRISRNKLGQIFVPAPPTSEQQRIITILDEAFAGIATAKANAEKNLHNARALFESHLQSVFSQRGEGWGARPLEKLATIINGFAFKSGDFSPKNPLKCIKITNVGVREFVCSSDGYLPSDYSEKYAAFSIKSGSIVLALTRTIISGGLKVAVVPEEYNEALLNQRVAAIITTPGLLLAPFLFAYLSTKFVADYVKERVNTLMQPNLSINDLRLIPIPLPTIQEQELIVDQLSSLSTEAHQLESFYRQKLTALDELKKSLLHQAFSGQL